LIRLDEGDHISDVTAVAAEEETEATVESVANNVVKTNGNTAAAKEPPKGKAAVPPVEQPSVKGKKAGKGAEQRGGKKKR